MVPIEGGVCEGGEDTKTQKRSIDHSEKEDRVQEQIMKNSFDLLKVVRPNIQKLKPYRCARDDFSDGQLMDANENSLGPPMNVNIISEPERYPCPHQVELKSMYAKWRGISQKNVFLGVGSDEAIDLLIRMACVPGKDSILTLPPTYGMYAVCAQVNDVNVVEVPLDEGFVMNSKKILDVIEKQPKQSPIKIVWVCHPNNPTGNDVATTSELEKLANSIGDAILVIDEAYVDFSTKRSSTASLIAKCPNVAVLQTFSKSWGLAGVRCGVCMVCWISLSFFFIIFFFSQHHHHHYIIIIITTLIIGTHTGTRRYCGLSHKDEGAVQSKQNDFESCKGSYDSRR